MTTSDAQTTLATAHRELSNLGSMLDIMKLAAEAADSNISDKPDVDWWGLLEVAKTQFERIKPHLEEVEVFLNKQWRQENSHLLQ